MMGSVLIYYFYTTIYDVVAIQQWQLEICNSLGLKGRIIIAPEGINGTIGGSCEATQAYSKALREHPLFSQVDIKVSIGNSDCFPRLRIVVKKEIVRLGIDPTVVRADQAGRHITAEETHKLLESKSDNLVVLDVRNDYESAIGKFEHAVIPPIKTFREFPAYIYKNKDMFKNKDVLMYCTAGVRCERASAFLKSLDLARDVMQVYGGIHRYVERFPEGYFRGKNYLFDERRAVKINDDIMAQCSFCRTSYDTYINCSNTQCNKQIISCLACKDEYKTTCSNVCKDLVLTGRVKQRSFRPCFIVPAKQN
jgi:predicted sulfurtransferase